MWWINRQGDKKYFDSPSCDSQKGAITVMTALLMVVLLAIVAMVLDLGMAYAEKAQLQNGADAAALAVAGECSTNPACTATDGQSLADQNSNDGASRIDITIDHSAGLVAATTSTLSNGTHFLSLPLAALTGFGSAELQAHAEARWGSVTSGTPILPITFGACELDPVAHPMDGVDRVLIAHGTLPDGGKCESWNEPAGLNMPGGFGWLTTGSNCTPTMTVDNPWVDSNPGASTPSGCTTIITLSSAGKTFLVPIFGYGDGTGANGTYKIVGWGVFVLSGWNLPANGLPRYNWPVSTSVKGLYGHFTEMLTYQEGFTYGNSTDYGASGATLTK